MRGVDEILQDMLSGTEIPESELLYYIHEKARNEFLSGFPAGAIREYSVVWYDLETQKCHIEVVSAANSILTLFSLKDRVSECHSVSVYPINLPKTLKFRPDSAGEKLLTLDLLLQPE